MARDLAVLVAMIAVGAGWMALHLSLLLQVLRNGTLGRGWKFMAWLPPLTPLLALRVGARVRPVLWGLLAVAYLGLWYAA